MLSFRGLGQGSLPGLLSVALDYGGIHFTAECTKEQAENFNVFLGKMSAQSHTLGAIMPALFAVDMLEIYESREVEEQDEMREKFRELGWDGEMPLDEFVSARRAHARMVAKREMTGEGAVVRDQRFSRKKGGSDDDGDA